MGISVICRFLPMTDRNDRILGLSVLISVRDLCGYVLPRDPEIFLIIAGGCSHLSATALKNVEPTGQNLARKSQCGIADRDPNVVDVKKF